MKFNIGDIIRQRPTGLEMDNDYTCWLIVDRLFYRKGEEATEHYKLFCLTDTRYTTNVMLGVGFVHHHYERA